MGKTSGYLQRINAGSSINAKKKKNKKKCAVCWSEKRRVKETSAGVSEVRFCPHHYHLRGTGLLLHISTWIALNTFIIFLSFQGVSVHLMSQLNPSFQDSFHSYFLFLSFDVAVLSYRVTGDRIAVSLCSSRRAFRLLLLCLARVRY